MPSPWRRVAGWWATRVVPFFADDWLALVLALFTAAVGLRGLWVYLLKGSRELFLFLQLFAIGFGWVYVLAFAWWAQGKEIDWRRRRIDRLTANHICLHCGYDMRITPDRCPECGRRSDEKVDPF